MIACDLIKLEGGAFREHFLIQRKRLLANDADAIAYSAHLKRTGPSYLATTD